MSFNINVKKALGNICDTCENARIFNKTGMAVALSKEGIKYSCLKNKVITIEDENKKPCEYYVLKFNIKKNMALRKIKPQFQDTPESNLMFAIIAQAVGELKDAKYK